MMKLSSQCLLLLLNILCLTSAEQQIEEEGLTFDRNVIEGRVYPPEVPGVLAVAPANWEASTQIHLNGGEFKAFVRPGGHFTIHNVPSGSYALEVISPNFAYESVRVEISSRGKIRARKLSPPYFLTQPIQVPYPLSLSPIGKMNYFVAREQWRVTDFVFNPMIIMMVLPLLLIMVLPKMMNDPEAKKEMEQINNLTKFEMPEVSEFMAKFMSSQPKDKQKQIKASKKKQ